MTPKVKGKVTYKLPKLLNAIVTSVVTKARSLRQVEARTDQIAKKHGNWMGINNRIADNTFSDVLHRLPLPSLISSGSPVRIHQRPIAGNTNEIGSMISLLEELKPVYGRTRLFSPVSTDSGNISTEVGTDMSRSITGKVSLSAGQTVLIDFLTNDPTNTMVDPVVLIYSL